MADSGKILATERPFPVQKAKKPPSEYIRATAFVMGFTPFTCTLAAAGDGPPNSGDLVIRNIFSRSRGAVQVRDTAKNCE